ncbi:MAG: outer membrane protein assembly factor BamD [Deltaproteobacteria bacterium]|jgi:outer membrane protein assembly factor BamD|nr:outer membrane protein assembly factor BamD [Deltaproteobacteria bacterium]
MADTHPGRAAKLLAVIFLAASLIWAPGCTKSFNYVKGLFGYDTEPEFVIGADEAANLASKAQERMDADDYAEAAQLWQQLRDQYLASPYSMLGALRLGDAYYLNEKYIEAANAYDTFEKRFPLSDAIPYVLYQKGMSYYQQMMGIDRDQTPAVQTVRILGSLVETYPDDKYAAMAKARIAEAQNNMAGHEFYVGEFYFKRKDYRAAMNRFMGLITYYPDSGYHHRAYNYIAQYRDLVARGEIDEGNQRPSEYDSPFTIIDINEPRY